MTGDIAFDDITVLDTIDSTNNAVRRRITAGATEPFAIASREQTRGRGRSGREWKSQSGNLAATFYHPYEGTHQQAARLSFAASLAVFDTLQTLAPQVSAGIKWPNDVLLNGKKVSGILLENLGKRADGKLHLMIGIGINLRHHPDAANSNWPPTSIHTETGMPPDFDQALSVLTTSLQTRLTAEAHQGFSVTRKDWLRHAVRLSETIAVRLPKETWQGIFRDIDETGALVLETLSGVRTVTAGDVFFSEGATCS